MYIYSYKDVIRTKIIDYKFNDKSYLYLTFAKNLINNKKVCDFINSYDIIIPVPIHNKRKMIRGYNQTELIAKKFVDDLNRDGYKLVLDTKCLIKIKNIQKQSLLTKNEREINICGAYTLKNDSLLENIKDKKILIFDDIYTTGSTVKECAEILRKITNNDIGILTIAKDILN